MSKCELCGATKSLVKHHRSYEPEVLQILCRACHRRVHGSTHVPAPPDDWQTTVVISKETRNVLKELGRKGETYDDVVRRLIKEAECYE